MCCRACQLAQLNRAAVERIVADLETIRDLMKAEGRWKDGDGIFTDAAIWLERAEREARDLLGSEMENDHAARP